jgi:hypothetical protein
MSTFKTHKAGMFSTSVYQSSAIPYISSSIVVPASGAVGPLTVSLPRVSKFVTVRNTVATASVSSIRVGFSNLGTIASGSAPGNNYFILTSGESYTGDWRVKDIYLMANTTAATYTATIIAGLTPISTSSISFDNWSGSLGVG